MCSSVLSAPAIINWVRNRTLGFTQVSNIITTSQPTWCFYFTGAVEYEVAITNPSGVPIFVSSGSISPPKACVWNGECNQPACSGSVTDGTCFYILTIKGCDGNTQTKTGFITVLKNAQRDSNISDNKADKQSASDLNENLFAVEIYPNPNSGIVAVVIKELSDPLNKNKVEVYNSLGSIIFKTETNDKEVLIDLLKHPKGVYIVKVENKNGIKTKKIIYQ